MTRFRFARLLLVSATLAGLAGVALLAKQAQPPSARMTVAANKFAATLSPEQKKKALLAFGDPHRLKWYFTPQQQKRVPTRIGLRLDEMSAEQQALALELLKAGLSAKGYDQATTIMSLEAILAELEGSKGANVRNPKWYFVSIFGEPSNTGEWGWRIEGHHLSVNFTMKKGQVESPTPLTFGANPAIVKEGPRKGLRTLPQIEELAKKLITSFNDEQKKVAAQPKQFPEIKEGQPNAAVGSPVGLPAAKMTDEQKATLLQLMEAYANRMPSELAKAELQRAKDGGFDKVRFGYHIAEAKKGKPYTYRIQGPTFVVEFLNVQSDSAGNPANHIHSTWRRLPEDFGLKQ